MAKTTNIPEPGTGMAVLHGYDPTSGKVTTDVYRESDESRIPSPWHRAIAMRDSVRDDAGFENWIWSVGQNERSHVLMTMENMRRDIGVEITEDEALEAIRG